MEGFPGELEARYAAPRRIGAGGFGAVWRAEDRELGRPVAIKLLHEEVADPEQRARFEREARLTSQLAHPGIVPVYDYGHLSDGRAYLVFQFVTGSDLASLLAERGPLPVADLTAWGVQVAEALHVAHQAGVVHRDVKPENVLVTDGGRPLLCDFGVARPESGKTVMTQEGLILGTPRYLAPEIWSGQEPTPATDQWAWAATLYQLAAGKPVIEGESVSEMLESALAGNWPALPGAIRREAPAFAAAVRRGLAPEPAERHPGMRTFAEALEAPEAPVQERATVRVEPAPVVPAPAPPRSPRRVPPMAILGLLACLVVTVTWLGSPGEAPPTPPSSPTPEAADPGDPAATPEGRAMVDACRRLSRRHLLPDGGYYLDRSADTIMGHYAEVAAELTDVTAPLRWNRYVHALRDWLALFPIEGSRSPTYRDALQRHVYGLPGHLLEDLSGIRSKVQSGRLLSVGADVGAWDRPGLLDDVNERIQGLRDLFRELLEGWKGGLEQVPTPLLLLASHVSSLPGTGAEEIHHRYLAELQRRLAARGSWEAQAEILPRVLALTRHLLLYRAPICDRVEAQLPAQRAAFEKALPEAGGEGAMTVLNLYKLQLEQWAFWARICDRAGDPAVLPEFDALLEGLRRHHQVDLDHASYGLRSAWKALVKVEVRYGQEIRLLPALEESFRRTAREVGVELPTR